MAPSATQDRSQPSLEFPLLKSLGLTTVNIDADGNCLFAALSDQVYGHIGKARHIRDTVVQHLRENPDNYKPFINYDGDRRGTRTRTRGRHSPTSESPEDVEEKIGVAWEQYLTSMSELGTWGDNLEIRAFACVFGRTVRVHRGSEHQDIVADKVESMMVQIAYHEWRHYSSVRSTEKRPKLTLTFKKRPETAKSTRESSYTTSASASQSPSPTPSSTSSVAQDLDSTDDTSTQAPLARKQNVVRKERDTSFVPDSPSHSSNGSSKRNLEDSGDEDVRSSKRSRP